MKQDEHIIRLHSIISRFILQIQTGEKILETSRSIGIPDSGYINFLMGLIYSGSQSRFQEESGLDEKVADDIFLKFWKSEGKEIKTRIIQLIEETN